MSLRARLLAAFAYTLLVVMVALEVPLGRNLTHRVNAEVETEASGQAEVVAADAASRRLRRSAGLDALVAQKADELGGRVVIVDGSGRVVADSAGPQDLGVPYATSGRPELIDALDGRISQGRRHSDTLDEDLLVTAVPVVRGTRTDGAVRVTQSVADVDSAVRDDVLALVEVGAMALLLGLGVAWLLAGSISRPIRGLASVARKMAGGDLEARADPAGSLEQVELARAFNEMADRVSGLLESQRAFVADASHQLRTPLTGLRLRLEAAGHGTDDPTVSKELEAADRETRRLADLVDDLLALAASEQAADSGPTDLSDAVSAAAERWRTPASDGGHDLAVEGAGSLPVRAPEGDLAAILDNLLENAIKYSSPGSPIGLSWGSGDGRGELRVSNRGEPLEPEQLERAFERFYRGASGVPGTGLGLAIVAALARRSGGRASLINGPDGQIVAEVELVLADGDFANS